MFLSIRPARKSAVETVFAVCESIHVVEHKSDGEERPNPKSTKNEGQRSPSRCFTHRFLPFSDKSFI